LCGGWEKGYEEKGEGGWLADLRGSSGWIEKIEGMCGIDVVKFDLKCFVGTSSGVSGIGFCGRVGRSWGGKRVEKVIGDGFLWKCRVGVGLGRAVGISLGERSGKRFRCFLYGGVSRSWRWDEAIGKSGGNLESRNRAVGR
jgi:hypothetical protein